MRKTKKILEETEKEIEKTEKELAALNDKLSHPDDFPEEIKNGTLYRQHNLLQEKLDQLYQRWEEIQAELEE